jgi:hypothetical protein
MLVERAFEDNGPDFDAGQVGACLAFIYGPIESFQRQLTRSTLPICCSTTPGSHSGCNQARAMAIAAKARNPLLPDAPTFEEQGIAQFDEEI